MKYFLTLTTLFFLIQCSSSTSSDFTTSELLQGTWGVTAAKVDGSVYPVTNPGLEQIKATFGESSFQYIYPIPDETGRPTANTDTLVGIWELNDDETVISITPNGAPEPTLVWQIERLLVGTLEVTFEQISATGQGTSTYNFTYSLTSN